jgi:iron complex outermembrane recepter protein
MIRRYCFKALVAAAGCATLGVTTPLFAAGEQTNAPANSGPALDEIIVTAQKRSESLETVAIAGTVFTSETRDLVGMESVQDLTNYTPGITYNHQLDRMFVRGVGRSSNNLSIDPAVATYLDGFYSSFNRVGDSSSLFIAQEEIYRGPQGTLFGRNAIGGAFNVSSPRPTSSWEGEGRLRVGNYNYKDIEGTISGPIFGDFLRFRAIAGEYKQDKGYFQSVTGHQNDGYGLINDQEFQVQFAGNITDKFEWWTKIDHHHWNNGYGTAIQTSAYITGCQNAVAFAQSPLICGGLVPNPQYNLGAGLNPAAPQLGPNPADIDHLRTQNDTENRERLKDDESAVFTAVFHMGFADVKYEAGYYSYEYDLVTDFDNTTRASYVYTPTVVPVPVTINSQQYFRYEENKHYYTNEIDLVSTNDSPLQWVAGLYQFHEKFRQPEGIGSVVPQPEMLNPVVYDGVFQTPTTPNPSGENYNVDQHTTSQSWAVFGQTDWKFAETLKATLGLRYNSDRRASEDMARYIFWDPTEFGSFAPSIDIPFVAAPGTPAITFNPATGYWQRHLEIASHAVTGTASLEWQPTTSQLGYAKYTRGYKDSGINSGDALAAVPYTRPEFVDAYELGWKQTFNRAFQVNSSLFYYKYKDAQLPFPELGAVPSTDFFNVNEKIYGLELETLWQATENLAFLLDYSYLHATLTDHTEFNDAYDNTTRSIYGNQVPGSPKNKATFNAVYTWHLDPGDFALSGTYAWRDRMTSNPFNDAAFYTGSYGVEDFRGTYTTRSNRWSVFGYIKNAFNVRGSDDNGLNGVISSPNPGIAGSATIVRSVIPPRIFGIEFRVRFGDKVK